MFISSIPCSSSDLLEDLIDPYPSSSVSISNMSSSPVVPVFLPPADLFPVPVLEAEPVLLRVFAIEDLLREVVDPADEPISFSSMPDPLSSDVPIEAFREEFSLLFPNEEVDESDDLFDSLLSFLDVLAICIRLVCVDEY